MKGHGRPGDSSSCEDQPLPALEFVPQPRTQEGQAGVFRVTLWSFLYMARGPLAVAPSLEPGITHLRTAVSALNSVPPLAQGTRD